MNIRGFSLLEVMIAIAILIIGLFAVVTLLLQGARSTSVITQHTIEITLGEEVIESARERYLSDIIAGNTFEDYSGDPDCQSAGDCVLGYEDICINSTCDGLEPACGAPLKQKILSLPGATNYNTSVYYDSNIGYFQTETGLSACGPKRIDYLRKVQTSLKNGGDTVEVCAHLWGPNSNIKEICDRFTDPRATP